MGGFEFWAKISEAKRGAVEVVIKELQGWWGNHVIPPELRNLAEELDGLCIVKPNSPDDVWMWTEKPDGTTEPYSTYKEYFGDSLPGEGEILVYCWEIPWLWKYTGETKSKMAECFARHGVLELWWEIIGKVVRADALMDQFWNQHGEEIFGPGIEIVKNKPQVEG